LARLIFMHSFYYYKVSKYFTTEPYTNKPISIYWTTLYRRWILVLASICLKNVLKASISIIFCIIPKNFKNCNYLHIRIDLYLLLFVFIEYLKEKTCILITHQIQYLTSVDQIVLIENVSIIN